MIYKKVMKLNLLKENKMDPKEKIEIILENAHNIGIMDGLEEARGILLEEAKDLLLNNKVDEAEKIMIINSKIEKRIEELKIIIKNNCLVI